MNMQSSANRFRFNLTSLTGITVALEYHRSLSLPPCAVEHSLRVVGLVAIPAIGIAKHAIWGDGSAGWSVNERSALRAWIVGGLSSGDSGALTAAPSLTARSVSGRNDCLTDLAHEALSASDALTFERAKAGVRGAPHRRIEVGVTSLALFNCSEPSTIHRTIVSSRFSNENRSLIERVRTLETEHDHGPIIPRGRA